MRLVELYDGTLFECQMIQNLLENEGIAADIKDEITGTMGGGWKPGGSVKVIVSDKYYDKAKEIVIEFERSRSEQ